MPILLLAAGCRDDRGVEATDTAAHSSLAGEPAAANDNAGNRAAENSDAGNDPIKAVTRGDAVRRACSACHVFPEPRLLPKDAWRHEIEQAYEIISATGHNRAELPPAAEVVAYYEQHAPHRVPAVSFPVPSPEQPAVSFVPHAYGAVGREARPMTAYVRWIPNDRGSGADCLVCDHGQGAVLRFRPDAVQHNFDVLAHVPAAAHVEPVDFNADGFRDFLVADLGSFQPSNRKVGRVLYLQHDPEQPGYRTTELVRGLGRVADVRAADFDRDGDQDFVVAVFGWRESGEVLYFENRTASTDSPAFHPTTLDRRTGAIHVPIADVDGDGWLDCVALLSQEHEQIVAFLGDGSGRFRSRVVFAADDPGYGSSGIQLIDFDRDGDLDVLYTNGDLLDAGRLKPSHGVQWLENEGRFPFRRHPLIGLPGAHSAVASDLDGDGDLDIAAVSFLPDGLKNEAVALPSLIWLEQFEPGRFRPHAVEHGHSDHFTLDVADFDGDGDPDLVTGNFALKGESTLRSGQITVWENRPNARVRP